MTITDKVKAYNLGYANALEAIDQIAVYDGDIERALDSYFCNLGDGLQEQGLTEFADDACGGFETVLIERNISARPHGMERSDGCKTCNGSGINHLDGDEICETCGGKGRS